MYIILNIHCISIYIDCTLVILSMQLVLNFLGRPSPSPSQEVVVGYLAVWGSDCCPSEAIVATEAIVAAHAERNTFPMCGRNAVWGRFAIATLCTIFHTQWSSIRRQAVKEGLGWFAHIFSIDGWVLICKGKLVNSSPGGDLLWWKWPKRIQKDPFRNPHAGNGQKRTVLPQ